MKIGILTGGGDVPPLNAVIFSARKEAIKSNVELVGFIKGWQGLLEKKTIDLKNVKDFSNIGGTYLKSSRINLLSQKGYVDQANSNLKNLGIDGLIIIGGDDTLSNAYYISEVPCVLISKTIDNDVGFISSESNFKIENIKNYFTLGYPSAVNRIISYVSLEEGIRTTAYSHERIIILESMGMHSGWLALSSGLGDPDFIIIPEFPLDYEDFCDKLIKLYNYQKHAVVVIAEGAKFKDSGFINITDTEVDDFGHPRFGGSSYFLRDVLKKDLSKFFNTRNINAVNPSYLYRSGKPVSLDFSMGQKMGKEAIRLLTKNLVSEPVLLAAKYNDGLFNIEKIPLKNFTQTENDRFPKRYVDTKFYDENTYQITSLGKEYLKPLVDSKLVNKANYSKEYNWLN